MRRSVDRLSGPLHRWNADGRLRRYPHRRTAPDSQPVGVVEALEGRRLLAAVTGLTLVDADTGSDLMPLADGTAVDLRVLPSRRLNVRADVDGEVESVLFSLDEGVGRVENAAPYALAGDDAGTYVPWTPSAGPHTVSATPYSADDAGGTSGDGLTVAFTVVDGVPVAPGVPSVEALGPDRVRLEWQDRSDNELGFVIARSQDFGRRYVTLAVVGPDATSHIDTRVEVGETYRYRVSAFNGAGRSYTSNSGLLRLAPPPAPEDVEAAALSDTEIRLRWSHPSIREEAILVQRSSDGTAFHTVETLAAGAEEFVDRVLAPSATYHYRVFAVNVVGPSEPSDVARATTESGEVVYAGPIVITAGGTYTGNWESLDPDVAAVTIRTTAPVVIEDANVRGRGALIKTGVDHARVTVRNTRGFGMNPEVYGEVAGRFFEGLRFDSVTLENNYLEGTAGINLFDYRGDHTPANSVRVVGNRALNIDGRKSDGQGGYLDFDERTRLSDGSSEKGYRARQFVQLNQAMGVPGMEIAWNEIVNEPGRSRVEDNISVFHSGGTAESPLRIHDNYVQGAYTIKPWQGSYSDDSYEYDWGYSGGGIMLGDGSAAYVQAYDNQVVSTSNYGIAISAGHDLGFYRNRVVSSGLLPDGRPITGQNVGVYIWDLHDSGIDAFYNNSASDNLVGWMKGTRRNDWWIPDATTFQNNTNWPGEITLATEEAELALWQAKLAAADVTVGPLS